jgi:hypothetical protein
VAYSRVIAWLVVVLFAGYGIRSHACSLECALGRAGPHGIVHLPSTAGQPGKPTAKWASAPCHCLLVGDTLASNSSVPPTSPSLAIVGPLVQFDSFIPEPLDPPPRIPWPVPAAI